jgi:peroxiredoxin
MILPKNTIAPAFELFETPDKKLSLAELKGKPVILAFLCRLESGLW